jgi:hypothetical protein
MPQIQVIEREDPARNPVNAFMEQLRQQQETISNVMYKKAQVEYQRDLAKINAKQAQNEENKFKADQEVKEWDIAMTILKQAEKAATKKDGSIDQVAWGKFSNDMVLSSPPGIAKKFATLAKQAPQTADAGDVYKLQSANLLGGMMGQSGEGGPQAGRANAVGGMIPKGMSMGPSGVSMDMVNPDAEAAITAARNQANQKSAADAGTNLVDGLESAWNDAFKHHRKSGIINPMQASSDFMGAASQHNPKVNEYIATSKATLSMIVRALGEKGTLTNQDIARIQAAIPTLWDSKDLASKKLSRLREIIKGTSAQGAPASQNEFAGMSDEELRKIASGGL